MINDLTRKKHVSREVGEKEEVCCSVISLSKFFLVYGKYRAR